HRQCPPAPRRNPRCRLAHPFHPREQRKGHPRHRRPPQAPQLRARRPRPPPHRRLLIFQRKADSHPANSESLRPLRLRASALKLRITSPFPSMSRIVQKYGGTSVGDVERIKKVAERIKFTVDH